MSEIRVVIVDDHALLRDGIRSLLERQPDIVVVGEASNGREAVARVAALLPDVVLMDIAMPEMDGLQATLAIKAQNPDVKILILTQHDSREYITPLLQAGASGYILKRSGAKEVVTAIEQVYTKGAYLGAEVVERVLQDYRGTSEALEQPVEQLTSRELEVLRLVVLGRSNKEIATSLVISPKTVSVHRTNIMAKLGVRNSAELVRYALQHRDSLPVE